MTLSENHDQTTQSPQEGTEASDSGKDMSLAGVIQRLVRYTFPTLPPGDIARLRRTTEAGSAIFWALWNHEQLGRFDLGAQTKNRSPSRELTQEQARELKNAQTRKKEIAWENALRVLAKLTPSGKPAKIIVQKNEDSSKKWVTDGTKALPHAWTTSLGAAMRGSDPEHPRVSNQRVDRLLSASDDERPALLERLLPLLKKEKFNLVELTRFMLQPNDDACRRIAKDYYR